MYKFILETCAMQCLQHNLHLLGSTQCCVIYLQKQIYLSLVNTLTSKLFKKVGLSNYTISIIKA